MTPATKTKSNFSALVALVARLRGPGGCSWDCAQTHESLKAALLEEAWEVIAAIEEGDAKGLREELGDLLLHVVMHAQMASEGNVFDINGVIDNLVDKLVRRHPHVFGDEKADTPEQVKVIWARVKQQENTQANGRTGNTVAHLPALIAALKVQHQVQSKDDCPHQRIDPDGLKALVKEPHSESAIGDLLYAVAALADQAGVDPELALQKKLLRVLADG